MQKLEKDYSRHRNTDELEKMVFRDFPQLNTGYALVYYMYEDDYVTIYIGTKAELEAQAVAIYQEGSLTDHMELKFYENGQEKQPKVSY